MIPVLAALGLVVIAGAGALGWMGVQARWLDRETLGNAYFARSRAERRRFVEALRRKARWFVPLARILARVRRLRTPYFEHEGVTGPAATCSPELFARTAAFEPEEGDVFVATQMKCGTTFMQQVVYEVLSRGEGNLGDDGHRHLYAVSPWIESRHSVSLEDAPRIGEPGRRLIKTHMPTRLCPFSERARYVYVVRDPVACFASCVDFLRRLGGPMAGTLPELVDWFCSDRMWWRSWPEHVDGWWRWSQEHPNVLFVHYEEMLEDLPGAVDRVAAHLSVDLTPGQRAAVVRKSGFDFMKTNEDLFEMTPPNFFSVAGGSFFVSGRRERNRDVGPAERERILAFCRERLRDASYPAARFYPDLKG